VLILVSPSPLICFIVSRIALVKPSKAKAIQDLLIRMAQSGQVRQKVTETQLIGLLDQVEGQGQLGGGGSSGAGKITVSVDCTPRYR
jgi:programmed cell death protein 5